MGNNSFENYTKFYNASPVVHIYPNEWARKVFMGTYPKLKRRSTDYAGKNVLDLGCGDGRNMGLLNNLGFNTYGVEISEGVCQSTMERLRNDGWLEEGKTNIKGIKVGRISSIPFPDNFFDCIFCSSSIYYIFGEESFEDNLREVKRVLKPGGWLLANFGMPSEEILGKRFAEGAEEVFSGHFRIVNDALGLRNGSIHRLFQTKEEIEKEFSRDFEDLSIGTYDDDYWGTRIAGFMLSCYKK